MSKEPCLERELFLARYSLLMELNSTRQDFYDYTEEQHKLSDLSLDISPNYKKSGYLSKLSETVFITPMYAVREFEQVIEISYINYPVMYCFKQIEDSEEENKQNPEEEAKEAAEKEAKKPPVKVHHKLVLEWGSIIGPEYSYDDEPIEYFIRELGIYRERALQSTLTPLSVQNKSENSDSKIYFPMDFSICSIDEQLTFLFGGKRKGEYLNSCYLICFDKEKATATVVEMTATDLLPLPRSKSAICAHDGLIYLHGGKDDSQVFRDLFIVKIEYVFLSSNVKSSNFFLSFEEVVTGWGSPQRHSHLMGVVDNYLYLFSRDSPTIDILSLNTYIWKSIAPYSSPLPLKLFPKNNMLGAMVKGPLIIFNLVRDTSTEIKDGKPFKIKENMIAYPNRYVYDTVLNQGSINWVVSSNGQKRDDFFTFQGPNMFLCSVLQKDPDWGLVHIQPGPWYKLNLPPHTDESLPFLLNLAFEIESVGDLRVICADGEFRASSFFVAVRKNESRRILSMVKKDMSVDFSSNSLKTVSILFRYLYTDRIGTRSGFLEDLKHIPELKKIANALNMDELQNRLQILEVYRGKARFSCENLYQDYIRLRAGVNPVSIELERQPYSDDFWMSFLDPDFVIICEGIPFPVHSNLMLLRSAYFRNLCSFNQSQREIIVEDISPESLNYVLNYVYFDSIDDIPPDLYIDVLAASNYFSVSGLLTELQRKIALKITPSLFTGLYTVAINNNAYYLQRFLDDLLTENINILFEYLNNPDVEDNFPSIYEKCHYIKSITYPPAFINCSEFDNAVMNQMAREYFQCFRFPRIDEDPPRGFVYQHPDAKHLMTLKHEIDNLTTNKEAKEEEQKEEEHSITVHNRFELLNDQV